MTKYPRPETIVVAPVTTDCHAVPPGLYVLISEAGIVFIAPPSFTTKPSPSASVIELPTDVPPSNKFNSVVVTVAPSKISNCASVTVADPTIKFPPSVVVPLISTLPFISTSVAFNSISSVALISKIAFDGAPIFCEASLN